MVILSPDGLVNYVAALGLEKFAHAEGGISFWAPDGNRYWLTNVVLVKPEKIRLEGTNVYAGYGRRRGLRTSFVVGVNAPIPVIVGRPTA